MRRKMSKNDPARLLGRRIRELRKNKRLTQEELGEKSGISYKYLGNIERGLENPSFKHLARIAKALGIELSELFEFEHLEPDREKLVKRINIILSKMSPSQISISYRLIKSLIK